MYIESALHERTRQLTPSVKRALATVDCLLAFCNAAYIQEGEKRARNTMATQSTHFPEFQGIVRNRNSL